MPGTEFMLRLAGATGKNLVPVYFPTAGAGSGGLHRQVLPLSTRQAYSAVIM
jgi:hypothetical protein